MMNVLQARTHKMAGLVLAACSAMALAVVSTMEFGGPTLSEKIGDIVLPAFEADVTAANEVKVTTQEGTYHLIRREMGWFLEERGDYPIRLSAIADLSDALSSMVYARQMTLDPKKFDRLGLGDPYQGGNGALMEVIDMEGRELVDLIIGFKNGAAYVRRPGDNQTWAVDASVFPPLQNPARWLDLDVMPIGPEDISRVEIEFPNGRDYALSVRYDRPGQFKLEPPYDQALLLTDYAPNPPALALARFEPLDALQMSEIEGETVAVHRTITHQGLVIETEILKNNDGYWAAFSGALQVDRDATEAQLDEIESRVAGWAFKLSRMDYAMFTTPIEDVISANATRQ